MRLEKVNDTDVFRPGDYELELKWSKAMGALETLLTIGSVLQATDPRMTIAQYKGKTLEPFVWNRATVKNAMSECISEFLKLRGEDNRLDSPMMVFRTGIEGVDLMFLLQIREQQPVLVRTATLDFELEHVGSTSGVFSGGFLQDLFLNLVRNAAPDYGVLRRLPLTTDDWYEETRVKIDLQKVPVAFEWFNYFPWDWVKRIGERRFDSCPDGEVTRLPIGLVYIIQKEPFHYDDPEHVRRQERVNRHFGLQGLHKQYAR